MGFLKELESWPQERVQELIARPTPAEVTRALAREICFPEDLAALLSPAAAPRLEEHDERRFLHPAGRIFNLGR